MVKRFVAFMLVAMMALWMGGSALAQEDTPPAADKALLVIFPEDFLLSAGEHVSAEYIGQVGRGAFAPMDAARIALGGQPLDDELRSAWAENPGSMELTTDLLVKGQLVQLYSQAGPVSSARVLGFDYSYSEASGDDHLSMILELGEEMPGKTESPLVFAIGEQVPLDTYLPNEMAITIADSSDGGYVIYELDLDGDGVDEAIMWDKRAASALDEEGVMHPLILSRGEAQLQTLEFFYDDSYTSPMEPMFFDLDGDGVCELFLAGTGHNTYVNIYQFENDAFVETGAGYYSGD